MHEVISLKKYRNQQQNKTDNIKATGYCEYNENLNTFIQYMASEVTKILDSPKRKLFERREEDEQKEFKERYKDVLSSAPSSEADKIPYYANIMLRFLPAIFNTKHKYKDRYKAYLDFSQIFLSEFDDVYCEYCRTNQKYEKEYPFRFIPLDADMLERELRDCLTLLISLSPAKNNTEKTEIMWQACRLSELHHNMVDLFSEEI